MTTSNETHKGWQAARKRDWLPMIEVAGFVVAVIPNNLQCLAVLADVRETPDRSAYAGAAYPNGHLSPVAVDSGVRFTAEELQTIFALAQLHRRTPVAVNDELQVTTIDRYQIRMTTLSDALGSGARVRVYGPYGFHLDSYVSGHWVRGVVRLPEPVKQFAENYARLIS